MKKATGEFLVGLTVLLGLAGVAVLLMMFGELAGTGTRQYTVYLRIADASGLTTASRLTLNGVPIGTIKALRADADPRAGVIIELSVKQGASIPRDAAVALERGLVGEAALALRTQPLKPDAPDPGSLAPGETLAASATGFMDQINAILDDKLSSFVGAADEIKKLAESFSRAGERLGEALEPRTPADVDAGKPANLVSAVARLDQAVKGAQAWLGDDTMRSDARSAVAKVNDLLDRASTAVESWNHTAETLAARADTLGAETTAALQDFAAAARNLSETAHQVQSITSKIDRGEGTAGLLVNNPDLYRSLNDAAVRLERALTEAQLLAEKYRKEGIPLKF
ncbi:MAG: MCE family protein [Phycisphaerae bacterium]|nr:MCE family protein [Phycisphaerae bacterium]